LCLFEALSVSSRVGAETTIAVKPTKRCQHSLVQALLNRIKRPDCDIGSRLIPLDLGCLTLCPTVITG
jgi:hypothetical protein